MTKSGERKELRGASDDRTTDRPHHRHYPAHQIGIPTERKSLPYHDLDSSITNLDTKLTCQITNKLACQVHKSRPRHYLPLIFSGRRR